MSTQIEVGSFLTDPRLVVSCIALITSVISLWVSLFFRRKALDASRIASLSHMVGVELSLKEIQTAIKFHGISKGDLQTAGITEEELSYLVASFTAGGIYHRFKTFKKNTPFEPDSYRYKMCINKQLRVAWPLVMKMMNKSPFTEKVERTIRTIEKSNELSSDSE